MEKDLRDAYRALSLVRADLVATRKAKTDLEEQWRAFAMQQRAQDAQRGAQLAQLGEAFRMREEDFRAQLLRVQAREHVKNEGAGLKDEEKASVQTESEDGEPETEDNQQQAAKHDNGSNMKSGDGEQDKQAAIDVAKDHMTLLATVYALRTQVQEQADQLLRQDANFTQERSEWSLLSEAMKQQIANLKESKMDLVREKKFMDEKFEFLSAEVDVVKSERDDLREQLRQWEQRVSLNDKTSEENSLTEERSAGSIQAELEEKLESLENEKRLQLEEHMKRIESLKEENDLLQRQLEAQQAATATLTTDLETLRSEARRLELEKDTTTSLFEKKRTVLESAWQEEKAELVQQLEESIAAGQDKVARVEQLARELDTVRSQLALKQQGLDDLAKDRTDLIQQLQQIRDHSTEQLNVFARQEEERMKTQLSEREKLQKELTTLRTSFEAAMSDNAIKMSSLQLTNDSLQQALLEKSHLVDVTQAREKDALHTVKRLRTALELSRNFNVLIRSDLKSHRDLVLHLQQQMQPLMSDVQSRLSARFKAEMGHKSEHFKGIIADLEQKLAAGEVDRSQLENELKVVQDAARTLQQQLIEVNSEKEEQMKNLEEIGDLRIALEAMDREVTRLKDLAEKEKDAIRGAHEGQLAALQSVHDKALHDAMIEQNSLVHENQELKLTLNRLEQELKNAHDATAAAEESLKQNGVSQRHIDHLEAQVSRLEIQLMTAEDCDCERHELLSGQSWKELSHKIRGLDDFLPQLQLFAGRLQTSLHLCAENARTMRVLSSSSSVSPSLLPDIAYLVQLADQWKQLFDVKGLSLHVRLVRRSVLATLAQWFEEGTEQGDVAPPPPPPFGIESQEVAIILQNWTSDVEKQKSVSYWLKLIASGENAAVDIPRDDQAASTLELKDMTREVKDAFSMLIVPLLKQNRNAFVRVFTRRVCDIKSSYSPDETCWEMRIHVQFSNRQSTLRRPESLPAPSQAMRRTSSSSSVSSMGSATSSVASSLSLSSISSASKLQIIQARLQQMQQQNRP